MSNMPDVRNIQRALRVQRDLDAKVAKRFRQDESMTVKDAYIAAGARARGRGGGKFQPIS